MVFDHLGGELVEHACAEPHAPLALRHRDEQRDDLERIVVEGDVTLFAASEDIVDKILALLADRLAQHAQGPVAGLARFDRAGKRGDSQHETKRVFRDDREHVRGRRILFRGGGDPAHHPLEARGEQRAQQRFLVLEPGVERFLRGARAPRDRLHARPRVALGRELQKSGVEDFPPPLLLVRLFGDCAQSFPWFIAPAKLFKPLADRSSSR
jgi:hypothetical protein